MPLAMYLYIIFIDPFFKFIKQQVKPIRISQANYKISAFVDDVSIFIENIEDIKTLERCIDIFEAATNSRVNKVKSKIFKLGVWTEEYQRPVTWINSVDSIKMLGIHWHQTISKTIDQNCITLVKKIKQSIQNTFNRLLTIQQKVIFFNSFIIPKLSHFAKILPIPKEHSEKIQQIGHNFIWRHQFERLAKNELYQPISEGGLNLVNAKVKFNSLFLKTILTNLTEIDTSENGKVIKYWIGLRLRHFFSVKPGPNCERPLLFLTDSVECIKKLGKQKMLTQETATKEIYQILILEEQKTPKVIFKSLNINFKPGFKAITNEFLSPEIKEHIFLQIHNMLPTKDRLIKCKQDINPKCDQCDEPENLDHLFV